VTDFEKTEDKPETSEDVQGHVFDKFEKTEKAEESDVEGHLFDKVEKVEKVEKAE
jgi:hypothetical protein